MEEQHLSLSEAADALNISERTAYRWIKSGKLRAYKPGRDYWIPESAIREVVKESVVRPKVESRSPSEPSFNDVLAEERRVEARRALERFCERWEAALDVGDFDRRALDEFGAAAEAFLPAVQLALDDEIEHLMAVRGVSRPNSELLYSSTLWPACERLISVGEKAARAYAEGFGAPEAATEGVVVDLQQYRERFAEAS